MTVAGGLKRIGRSFGGLNGKSFGDDATVTLAIWARGSSLQSSRPSYLGTSGDHLTTWACHTNGQLTTHATPSY